MVSALCLRIEQSGFELWPGILPRVLGQNILLSVPISTRVYKWVPPNLMLGVTLEWRSIPSGARGRGWSKNTPNHFMLQKPLEI